MAAAAAAAVVVVVWWWWWCWGEVGGKRGGGGDGGEGGWKRGAKVCCKLGWGEWVRCGVWGVGCVLGVPEAPNPHFV